MALLAPGLSERKIRREAKLFGDEGGNSRRVIQGQNGTAITDKCRVIAGGGEKAPMVICKQRPHQMRSMNFDLTYRGRFKSFDKNQINRRQAGDKISQLRPRAVAMVFHQKPSLGGGKHDLGRSRRPVKIAVFIVMIQLDAMMGMFDRRYAQPGGMKDFEQR